MRSLQLNKQASTRAKYLTCIMAGCLLPYAYAASSIWILAIIAPLALLWACESATPKQAFKLAFVFGFIFYCVATGSAINGCFRGIGYKPQALSMFLTALFFMATTFFLALPVYVFKKFYPSYTLRALWLGLPCAWVICEWIRSWLFTGYPFFLLGYTQLNTPLKHYAAVSSVYGVSFIVMLLVGLCYTLLQAPRKFNRTKSLASMLIALIWLGGYVLQKIQWTSLGEQEYSVSIVQPNITPAVKRLMTEIDQWQVYGAPTNQALGSSLIIWPELSMPSAVPYVQPMLDGLDQLAKNSNSALIVGVHYKIPDREGYYNSLMVLGTGSGVYHKQHLVPLWEEVSANTTLHKALYWLDAHTAQYKPGAKNQENVHLPNSVILPLVCFEIAFANEIQERLVETNANVLVNISEDGWFADSWGPEQHLDLARMRAIETGRYVLRATTSGYSAIIDAKGTVLASIPMFKAQVLRGTYKNVTGSTPWVRLGMDRLIAVIAFILLFSMFNVAHFRTWRTNWRLLLN